MKKTKILRQIIIMIAVILMAKPVFAQYDLTIYPMQSIPQSNYNNPALVPDCKLHIGALPIGLPVLPSLYFGIGNSGFAYNSVIRQQRIDSSTIDIDYLVNKLAKKNYLTEKTQLELFSFGIKIKRTHYISIGMTEKQSFRLCYPGDLISMAALGNYQFAGGQASFNGLGLDWIHYREIALGYTNQIDDKWTIGGRAKLLFGMSNVWTKKTKATLDIDENTFDFTAKTQMNINLASTDDLMNFIESDDKNKNFGNDVSIKNYLLNTSNLGVGLDLGVNYKLNEKFSFAASCIDFGYIHWKTGARNYVSPDTTFVFEGLDINTWLRKDDSTSNKDVLDHFIDSVVSIYQLDTTYNAYWAPLNPVVYMSAFYTPTLKDKVSLVGRLEIYKGTVHPAFTLGYYRKFGKALSVAINYSYYNRSWLNVGFGAALKAGPFQFFITTDNVLSGITPYAIRNINVHFGANLVFFQKNYYPLWE